ncbi:MAG: ABC transporter substrate-binding protein [Thermodesulfobacteriota bacterium]
MNKKYISLLAFSVFLFLMFFSCTDNKEDLNEVTLRLKWIPQAQFAGYYAALDKGYYRDEGLIVNIEPGMYGKNPLKTVKNGAEEFGVQWASDLVAEGEHFISLANIVKDNGFVLITKKKNNIKDVSDFKNRKIATWFIGHEYQLYALLEKYGLGKDDVEFVSQKWDMSQFYKDQADVVSAQNYNELLRVFENGYSAKNLEIFDLKKLGVDFPGQNIFTSRTYFENNPKICRALVKASIRGWKFTVENPEKAVDILLKYDKSGELEKDFQLKQVKEIIGLIKPDQYKLGIHLKKDYDFITSVYSKYGIIPEGKKAEKYYTNILISH